MKYWQRNDGVKFATEEEAFEDSLSYCDEDLIDALCDTMNSDKLLQWAMKQESFWDEFQDEIASARNDLFEWNYCSWEVPDDYDEDEF